MGGRDLRVHVALLAAQLSFGGFHVVAKALLADLHPLVLAGARVLVAAPLLLLFAWRRDRVVPSRRDLPLLALLGFLGVFANQVLFIVGLDHTTATNAAILMASIPVFAVGVGALSRAEGIGPRRLLGLGLAVLGTLVVLDPGRFALESEAFLGNALILLNCLSYAIFLVLHRPALARLPWRTVLAWAFVFGGGAVTVLAAPWLAAFRPAAVPAGVWAGLAYVVLFATVLAYSWNTWAVRRSSATLVAAYTTLQPLVAAVLAAVFLGEELHWRQGLGFALIAGGLWRVSLRPPRAATG